MLDQYNFVVYGENRRVYVDSMRVVSPVYMEHKTGALIGSVTKSEKGYSAYPVGSSESATFASMQNAVLYLLMQELLRQAYAVIEFMRDLE